MKKVSTLVLIVLLSLVCVVSCKDAEEKQESQSATESSEMPETSDAKSIEIDEKQPVFNANLATMDDLKTLGLSDAIIQNIIAKRPFLHINDLAEILTGQNTAELYKNLFVPLNLNTTAEADFKIIPGVGDKMAHEFEEYRPYKSVKQFQREIGKYVDEDEVARYLNYVFVPVELNTASEEDIKALPGVGNKMAHEFEEYRPYKNLNQFRKEIGKYVDDKELKRLERLVYIKND